jgi:hypothetical protein
VGLQPASNCRGPRSAIALCFRVVAQICKLAGSTANQLMRSAEVEPPLSKSRRNALVGGVLGNAFEAYDTATYGYLAVAMGKLFFFGADPAAQLLSSLALFGVTFFMRPGTTIWPGRRPDRPDSRADPHGRDDGGGDRGGRPPSNVSKHRYRGDSISGRAAPYPRARRRWRVWYRDEPSR